MNDARKSLRELVVSAFDDSTGIATIDLPDGSIGVIDLDDSRVFVVTIKPGKFEVAS